MSVILPSYMAVSEKPFIDSLVAISFGLCVRQALYTGPVCPLTVSKVKFVLFNDATGTH